MELEKPFREAEAKLEKFDQEIESIPDKKQRANSKTERQAQLYQLRKQLKDAKAKYESAESLLETMQDFKTNSWLIKKVRFGSDAWKDIKKRLEGVPGKQPDTAKTADEEAEEVGENGEENRKARKPPKLLGKPDFEKDKIVFVYDFVSRAKLIGRKTIKNNFGIAILDKISNEQEKFVVIPWHKVWPRIYGPNPVNGEKSLIERNGGQRPRILRGGTLIRLKNLPQSRREKAGIWMVRSVKASLKLDLSRVDFPQMTKDPKVWREVALESLGADNIAILPNKLTGVPDE